MGADHEVGVLRAPRPRLELWLPVSDALLTAVAELRHACREAGHPLHEPVHANDLWITASALHIGAPLLTADTVFDDVPGVSLHR